MRIKWTKEHKDLDRMERDARIHLRDRGIEVVCYNRNTPYGELYERKLDEALADFDYSAYIVIEEYSAEVVSTIVIDNKPHFVYVLEDGTFGYRSIDDCIMETK